MSDRRQPPPFPWPWLLPMIVELAVMVVWGVVAYPRLPDRIPQHIGPDGVDAYSAKSVLAAFGPVFVFGALVVVLAGTALLVLRTRPREELAAGEGDSPFLNRPHTRRGAVATARATLVLGACLGVTFLLTCAVVWRPDGDADVPGWLAAGVVVPSVVGAVPLVVATVRDARAGRALRRQRPHGS